MKAKFLSLVIVATVLISTVAVAQPADKQAQKKFNGPDRKAMIMKRQAMMKGDRPSFFTEEQKEAMKKIHLETAKQVKPLKNELNELMARQKTLATADEVDMKDINKNIEKMSDVKTDLAKLMAKSHQDVRALLNEEQLLKFDTMKGKQGKGTKGKMMDQRNKKGGSRS